MVRKLTACLAEIGRGTIHPDDLRHMLHSEAESFQPTAPPSGLFLEAVVYSGETFDRPLIPIVPVTTFLPRPPARGVPPRGTSPTPTPALAPPPAPPTA